ncbi:MAG: PIN domain-containing protein [Rhizobacter sp.]|nr:PIN domain-containing protein [Rhizobacter sp.]
MQEVHVLVDLENNQPTLDEVRKLVPNLTEAWRFHSKQQTRRLQSFEAMGDRRTLVPITRPGKNSLDFHLSFYLGYIAARNPKAKLVVVAIDNGYGPMILHAKEFGFDVRKVAYKPKAVPAKAAAAKKTAPAAKKASTKRVAKKAAPAKKPLAKTTPALKAKTAPAKNGNANPASKSGPTLQKAIANFRKMGDKRPKKLKPTQRHIASMLGTGATEADVHRVMAGLLSAGAVEVTGEAVRFGGPVTDGG